MKPKQYYLLKVKGLGAKADFVQVRNQGFELLANLKCEPPYNSLARVFKHKDTFDKVVEVVSQLEYGELKKLIV